MALPKNLDSSPNEIPDILFDLNERTSPFYLNSGLYLFICIALFCISFYFLSTGSYDELVAGALGVEGNACNYTLFPDYRIRTYFKQWFHLINSYCMF